MKGKSIGLAILGIIAGTAIVRAGSRTQNLKAKIKLNPQIPNRVSIDRLNILVNFPIEVLNQSAVNINLRNLLFNVQYKDITGNWQDLLIQRNIIDQVNFPPGRPQLLSQIPLSISLTSIPTLLNIIRGRLSSTLLVNTRFEVAGVEIEPIQTEVDAKTYLQPIIALLTSRGLVNGLNFGLTERNLPGATAPGLFPAEIGYGKSFHYRAIKDASAYSHLIPSSKGTEKEIRKDGTAYDTIEDMANVVATTLDQTKKLAKALTGNSREATTKNIYQWLYDHIQYKQDEAGTEQLREPAKSFADRKSGIDCDCFSIFASSLLTNVGIDHYIQMCMIEPDPWFKHVYVVVPKKPFGKIIERESYWVVDPCLHRFDQLAPKITQTYSKQMRTVQLGGLDASCLCQTNNNVGTFGKKPVNVTGKLPVNNLVITKEKINEMELQVLEPIRQNLIKTREQAIKNPGALALMYQPGKLVQSIDYALKNWNNPNTRIKALEILAQQDQAILNKKAFAGLGSVYGIDPSRVYPVIGVYGLSGLGETGELTGLFDSINKAAKSVSNAVSNTAKNAVQAVKNTPSAVKEATQKAGEGIKNAAQFVAQNAMKINPVAVAARTAYRGLVSINFRGDASRMAQAIQTPAGLAKLKSFWEQPWIGGNWGDLLSAINAGKGKKPLLNGYDITGLGEPVTIAASVATATPILVKIADVISDALKNVESVKKVTDNVSKVSNLVNQGKTTVQNLIPGGGKSSPAVQSSVVQSGGNQIIKIDPVDPGVQPNAGQVTKSTNWLGIAALALAGLTVGYAVYNSGSSNKRSVNGVPTVTI